MCNKFMYEKRDVEALKKFARIVKLGKAKTKSGGITFTGHLDQTYPNIEKYNTIPFNCHENKTFCVMPIELISAENINKVRVLDLVAFLCQSLTTFFKIREISGRSGQKWKCCC